MSEKNMGSEKKKNPGSKKGKKWRAGVAQIESLKAYDLEEALGLAVKTAQANFDESIDVSVCLGIDIKQSDQQVRGAVNLPHGLGRLVRVIVFAKGPKEKEAMQAGADVVGAEDLVEKIKKGWLDFDRVIATPDMMAVVSRVAKILGPRGLMPNPKVGTVTTNVAVAVSSEKKGKLVYRTEKSGLVQASIGRKSMGEKNLKDNFLAFLGALMKAKPSSSKGVYLRSIHLASTMGPGVKVDANRALTVLSGA